jgi:hypothetical protein
LVRWNIWIKIHVGHHGRWDEERVH